MGRYCGEPGFTEAGESAESGSTSCSTPLTESSPVVVARGMRTLPQDQPPGVHQLAGGAG
eukprot:3046838-Alexandrium_andersonii.AAC.1